MDDNRYDEARAAFLSFLEYPTELIIHYNAEMKENGVINLSLFTMRGRYNALEYLCEKFGITTHNGLITLEQAIKREIEKG